MENKIQCINKIQLENSIDKLIEIFQKENKYLKNMQLKKLADLVEEKAKLIIFMAEVKSILRSQEDHGLFYDQEEKDLVVDKYRYLERLMKENLLIAGHTASAIRNIIYSLNKRIFKKNTDLATYSNKGTKIN